MSFELQKSLYELICRASTDLPADVEQALHSGKRAEEEGSNARRTLSVMLENVDLARQRGLPLCQDTGGLLFWVEAPPGYSQLKFMPPLESAIKQATEEGVLRQNCVESLTGRNSGTNLGRGSPVVHWREHASDKLRISLLLKGGGCENVGVQYALPDQELSAERNLEGVRRCCLDAVWRAQGRGCSPGVLGVCVGGDRATGYEESKRQFLRSLGERSDDPDLADLENKVLTQANELGIGPMGFGGRTTLLDVFIGRLDRLPASFFVSVSYMCWSFRRHSIVLPENQTTPSET